MTEHLPLDSSYPSVLSFASAHCPCLPRPAWSLQRAAGACFRTFCVDAPFPIRSLPSSPRAEWRAPRWDWFPRWNHQIRRIVKNCFLEPYISDFLFSLDYTRLETLKLFIVFNLTLNVKLVVNSVLVLVRHNPRFGHDSRAWRSRRAITQHCFACFINQTRTSIWQDRFTCRANSWPCRSCYRIC